MKQETNTLLLSAARTQGLRHREASRTEAPS